MYASVTLSVRLYHVVRFESFFSSSYDIKRKSCEQGLITKKNIAMHTNSFKMVLYSIALVMKLFKSCSLSNTMQCAHLTKENNVDTIHADTTHTSVASMVLAIGGGILTT